MMTNLLVKSMGIQPYAETFEKMVGFTLSRTEETPDEFWCLEHPAVYTQGQAGRPEHIQLNQLNGIPLIQSDRGGQVTYHGPGQLIVYTLIDLRRKKLTIKDLVHRLEQSVIQTLQYHGISGQTQTGAPGIYVEKQKIASLGLRVKKGCCYHGLALNVHGDLQPFHAIDPCGQAGLQMTSLENCGINIKIKDIQPQLIHALMIFFDYLKAPA